MNEINISLDIGGILRKLATKLVVPVGRTEQLFRVRGQSSRSLRQ